MDKRCYIFAGAEIEDYSTICLEENRYVICADYGYSHARRVGIMPDCVVGDFDTLKEEISDECEVLRYPSEKDDTDTMLAVKLALERGYKDITVFGAVGGRLDHTIAVIQTLEYIHVHGAVGRIAGDNQLVMLQSAGDTVRYERKSGYFSLFAMTEECTGVTTRGLKYNLTDAVFKRSFPWGVSNEFCEDYCEIQIKSGLLLVIYAKDKNQK